MRLLQHVGLSALLVTLFTGCTTAPSTVASPAPPENYIARAMKPDGAGFRGSCDVTCSVNALGINFDGVEPARQCRSPDRTVNVTLARTAVAGRWLGTMQGVQPEDPTRFEVVPNSAGAGNVGRTPFGWFPVTELNESGGALQLRMDASRQLRPTKDDVAIINRAIALIPTPAAWNKNDNRECPPGQAKLSMFCALTQATTEISGGVHYRQPAMQAVREVLNTVDASRIKTHRIMDYNNHPATTLDEIHGLLRTAQARVERDIR
jgi:hypothetical protein